MGCRGYGRTLPDPRGNARPMTILDHLREGAALLAVTGFVSLLILILA